MYVMHSSHNIIAVSFFNADNCVKVVQLDSLIITLVQAYEFTYNKLLSITTSFGKLILIESGNNRACTNTIITPTAV